MAARSIKEAGSEIRLATVHEEMPAASNGFIIRGLWRQIGLDDEVSSRNGEYPKSRARECNRHFFLGKRDEPCNLFCLLEETFE